LLSGVPPFFDEDNFELFEKIKRAEFHFKAEGWKNVSNEAKNFVSNLLTKNPDQRIKGSDIMKHPWIVNSSKSQTEESNVLEQMRDWNSKRKLNNNLQ
jgi:serine/threonine protein kinase